MWWLWSKALKRWSDGLLLAKTIWVVSGWLTQCITINRKLKLLWVVWTSCVINNWTTTTVFPSKLTGTGGCSNIFSRMNVIMIRFGGSFQFSGLEFLDVLVEHLKLETIWSCMTEVGAQLAADMLLSRPLGSPYVAPILLPIGWSPVNSRVTPWLVVVAGVVGMLVATGMTLITAEIWAVMRHGKMSRGLLCWQQWWLLQQRRREQRGSGIHGIKGVLVQKFMGRKVAVKISI